MIYEELVSRLFLVAHENIGIGRRRTVRLGAYPGKTVLENKGDGIMATYSNGGTSGFESSYLNDLLVKYLLTESDIKNAIGMLRH